MAIIAFHESLHADPRVCQVGTEAFGLWVASVCYASRNYCEVYPEAEALANDPRGRLTVLLLSAEFWEAAEEDGGYRVLAPPCAGSGHPAFRIIYPSSDVPPETRRAVFRRDGEICKWCGATDDLTIDHIWPQVLGGGHDLDNLQVLCRPCNSSKGARV